MSTIQTQKQILAPVLQQSISILMLSLGELNTSIEQEIQNNPMLEIDPKKDNMKILESNYSHLNYRNISESTNTQLSNDEIDKQETQIVQLNSLEDHLLTQLRIEITTPLKRTIGELIIGNLDSKGFLSTSLEEIALLAKTSDIKTVEEVLKIIQLFDPIGIASRNVKECLLIQVKQIDTPIQETAVNILENHFDILCKNNHVKLAKALHTSTDHIKRATQLIASLEPQPAREYQGLNQTVYVQPDVFLIRDTDGQLHIEVNKNDIPLLRINPQYAKLLDDKSLSSKEKEFIQEKLSNALNFIKSIQLRGETLLKISRYIVEHQKDFFEGNSKHLNPMKIQDVAKFLNRNDSTVSRAINNKYMETPMGLFPLRYFFTLAINDNNKGISSHTIKEEIRLFVDTEDKNKPLTDQEIIDLFKAKGVEIARRTINKYRQELEIPPSHKRRK